MVVSAFVSVCEELSDDVVVVSLESEAFDVVVVVSLSEPDEVVSFSDFEPCASELSADEESTVEVSFAALDESVSLTSFPQPAILSVSTAASTAAISFVLFILMLSPFLTAL